MKRIRLAGACALLLGVLACEQAVADSVVTVARKCINGVCGQSKYYGGKVRITLSSQLSRNTHYNFKTNPGDQIEIGGGYSFDKEPGRRGTYSAQACDRGGIGARSTCTSWATFSWRS